MRDEGSIDSVLVNPDLRARKRPMVDDQGFRGGPVVRDESQPLDGGSQGRRNRKAQRLAERLSFGRTTAPLGVVAEPTLVSDPQLLQVGGAVENGIPQDETLDVSALGGQERGEGGPQPKADEGELRRRARLLDLRDRGGDVPQPLIQRGLAAVAARVAATEVV